MVLSGTIFFSCKPLATSCKPLNRKVREGDAKERKGFSVRLFAQALQSLRFPLPLRNLSLTIHD
jgi:hypothetical protein